jgi:excisionase family DNA binding protein
MGTDSQTRRSHHTAPAIEMTSSPFLTADEVAARLRCSLRTVHELARRNEIPLRRLPGCRRLLFAAEHLAQWEDGAALEIVQLSRGGRVVRPVR